MSRQLERPRGATGHMLDNEKMTAVLKAAYPEHNLKLDGDHLLVKTRENGYAALISEGVAGFEKDGKVYVWVRPVEPGLWAADEVPLDVEAVVACAVEEETDLADHIRRFGSRLENNFGGWFYEVTGKEVWEARNA